MNETAATPRRWPHRVITAGLWVLAAALLVLILDGPLYRMGVMPLVPALLTLVVTILLTAVSFLLLLIGVLARRSEAGRKTGVVPIVALVAAAALVVNFAIVMQRAFSVPPIHDITTNLQDPPDFADVVPLRQASGAMNPPEYVREARGRGGATIDVPAAQRAAYPDIGPERLPMPPAQAFELADRAAREMGWEIVASVPSEGRIEATDTTGYFGFKDDVAIRVRAEAGQSRVDVRSKSRVGVGDVGANAARIRKYLDELRSQARG